MISRRSLLTGAASLLAAPAIVRASSLDFIPRSHMLDWSESGVDLKTLGVYNITDVGNWYYDCKTQVFLRRTTVRRLNECEDITWERIEARKVLEDALNVPLTLPPGLGRQT